MPTVRNVHIELEDVLAGDCIAPLASLPSHKLANLYIVADAAIGACLEAGASLLSVFGGDECSGTAHPLEVDARMQVLL